MYSRLKSNSSENGLARIRPILPNHRLPIHLSSVLTRNARAAGANEEAKEGIPASKIKISSDDKSIVASLATDQEYQAGKIYFDKVMDDIDKDQNWIANL